MRLHDMIEFFARNAGDRTAARDGRRAVTYAELNHEADQFATMLAAQGVQRGQRVAMLAQNCIEYYAVYFGAAKAGIVTVPLNPRLAAPEWAFILSDSESKLVVARGVLAADLDAARDRLSGVETFIALDTDGDPGLGAPWVSWADAVSAASPPAGGVAPDPPVNRFGPVVQMYTSGTTGRPKGAVLTHDNLTSNIVQSTAQNPEGLTGCGHIVAPLAHIGSALTSMLSFAAGGSVYVQEDFDMPEVVRILDEEGVNRTMLVPAMIQALLVFVPDAAERSYDDLEQIGYGASPIAPEVLRQAMDTFGCDFTQGYGMTESSGGLTGMGPEDHRRAVAGEPDLLLSAGRAMLGTEIRVVDEDGDDVAPGEVGEILARGPQVMSGYWNLPEATEATLRDGWLHTGDAGSLDEDGYLYVKDRVKDMVVTGGENVYPAEVEKALFEHEAVADVAVIGVPDEKWGEAVKACVVLTPDGEADADELIAFCRDRLAGFKTPKSVDFLPELPRNASMKVLKTELRKPYWADHDRQVG